VGIAGQKDRMSGGHVVTKLVEKLGVSNQPSDVDFKLVYGLF
jgi:hypothetical protein